MTHTHTHTHTREGRPGSYQHVRQSMPVAPAPQPWALRTLGSGGTSGTATAGGWKPCQNTTSDWLEMVRPKKGIKWGEEYI